MANDLEMCRHFRLKRKPWSNPKSNEIYRTDGLEKLLGDIVTLVEDGEMFAVCGASGTGKTILRRMLCEMTDDETNPIVAVDVSDPDREAQRVTSAYHAIQNTVNRELCGALRFRGNRVNKQLDLKVFLGHQNPKMRMVLMIDEAHRVRGKTLRAFKEFGEISYADRASLVSVMFMGQADLRTKLHAAAPDVWNRIEAAGNWLDMTGYEAEDVKGYIYHRTRQAGNVQVFAGKACYAIARLTKRPIEINRVMRMAMQNAYAVGAKKVMPRHITGMFSIEEKIMITGLQESEIARRLGVSPALINDVKLDKYQAGTKEKWIKKIDEVLDEELCAEKRTKRSGYRDEKRTNAEIQIVKENHGMAV